MKKTIYSLSLTVLFLSIVFNSCGTKTDDPKPDPDPEFTVPEFVLLDDAGNKSESVDLQLENWTATTDADWLKIKKEGTQLILSAEMWINSPKGTKENVQERETEIRETKVTVKVGSTEKSFTAKQENIYVGKLAQGGIIYWLNTGEKKIADNYPDCKGLVLSLEESPYIRPFLAYDISSEEKDKRKQGWVLRKSVEIFKTKYLPFSSADGVESTKQLLKTCEEGLKWEKGTIPSFEEYPDWSFKEKNYSSATPYNGPNYIWFKERYWQKEVNGYSDWYIATLEEMSPMFKWGEFLFMDIKAIILKQWESGLEYDDIEIIPLDTKFQKNGLGSGKGVCVWQEDRLVTILSSGNFRQTGPTASRFIDFTNPKTGKYSSFDSEEKFNELHSKGTIMSRNTVVRPIRRF